jgi:hypothetical protein
MAMFLLGFLNTFVMSRRITEGSVIQSAASSLVDGLVEQMKMIPYDQMPSTTTDTQQTLYDAFGGSKTPPYIRVRLNQDQLTWLLCTNNLLKTTFVAPTSTPTSTSVLDATQKNTLGPFKLSSVSGANSQPLTVNLWVWVDQIANGDIVDAKCVTVVYAYNFNDGHTVRSVINREVFVRSPFK